MYISSDTNIWIDFNEINHLEHPFLLRYEYFISSAALEDELIEPPQLREKLLELGLRQTEITDEELALAKERVECHGAIWIYDELLRLNKINDKDYKNVMNSFLTAINEGRCRLPLNEISSRLQTQKSEGSSPPLY